MSVVRDDRTGLFLPERGLTSPQRRRVLLEHYDKLSPMGKLETVPPLGGGMDGAFYWDSRFPFMVSDLPAITLSTTAKALYAAQHFPNLGGQYFGWIGKKMRIRMFGKITTAATPGNGSFNVYWGTGADANGTILASSAALALSASQTSLSWRAEIDIVVRALGATGALLCTGKADFNNAVLANTLQPMLIPASVAAQVTVDLTNSSIISVQFKRSGSTVETMQVHDMTVESLN